MSKLFSGNDFKKHYGDERLLEFLKYDKKGNYRCIYCFGKADSREHCPSKVFLEQPYPNNLVIVPSCNRCNNLFSEDELYTAVLIEYLKRVFPFNCITIKESMKKRLNEKPYLLESMERATNYDETGNPQCVEFDVARIKSVITKLATGHSVYMLSRTHSRPPDFVEFKFLTQFTQSEYNEFNSCRKIEVFPEVGSRDAEYLTIIEETNEPITTWNVVQKSNYRFLAQETREGCLILLVIGEYLFAEIRWTDLVEKVRLLNTSSNKVFP